VLPFEVAYSTGAAENHSNRRRKRNRFGFCAASSRAGEAAPRSAAPEARSVDSRKIAASDGGIHAEGMVADLVFCPRTWRAARLLLCVERVFWTFRRIRFEV